MWSVPAPSPAFPSPWTLIDLLSNSDNCCLTRKCRRAVTRQISQEGRSNKGRRIGKKGNWGEEISRKAITSQSGGIKKGNLRPFTACNLITLDILCFE